MKLRGIKMQILINQQKPRHCPGRTTKYPPVECEPFCWMKDNMPPGTIADLDGFTIDENNELVTGFLQKREYNIKDYKIVLDCEQIKRSLIFEDEDAWKLRCKLSIFLEVPLFLAIWPIDYPIAKYTAEHDVVIVFRVTINNDELQIRNEFVGDINDLTALIRKLRGRTRSTTKFLNVATTMMECYLANTSDTWPGNLDAFTWDPKKEIVTSIIEFKTHNHPDYPISSQYFGQWPEDRLRLRALDIMQKFIATKSSKPKLLFIVWGTHKSHIQVKLQTINDLRSSNDMYVNRPRFTNASTKQFTDEVLAYF